MEDTSKHLRITGIIEFIAGFIFVVVFGPTMVQGLSGNGDVTVIKIIARIIATLIGFSLIFYGLKVFNENSDRALIPVYFWAVVVVGMVTCIIYTIISIVQDFSNIIFIYEPIAIITISIPLLFAYRNNKPTLITLCICFVLLYIFESIVALVGYMISGEGYPLHTILLRFIYGTGWLLYFFFSKKLSIAYPKDSRTTPQWPIWIVGINAIFGVIMLILVYGTELFW